ncbi:MAG: CPBP family intramembrane glutamic endopeptidase [Egibacteraceae bacterium]
MNAPESSPSGMTGNLSRPWVPWTWLDAVGAFALTQLATVAFTLAVFSAAPGASDEALLALSHVVFAATVLSWVAIRYRADLLRLFGPRRPHARAALVGAGVGLLVYLVVNLGFGAVLEFAVRAGGQEVPVLQETFREAATDPVRAPLFILSAVLLAPVAEELFFRGLLFQALRVRLGATGGILISGLVFGAVHVSAASALANGLVVAVTTLLGVGFAWAFHRYGSLLVPVLAHMTVNLISTVLIVSGMVEG